jgi:Tfp pilus assembly protein PilN
VTPPAMPGGIHINLLPPEILQKRKAESRRLVFLAVGLTVVALLGLTWMFGALFVGIKTQEVASAQQDAASLRSQAASFKVFEDRAADLTAREAVANRALDGRIEWSRIMGDLSLVLPPDIWLGTLDGVQRMDNAGAAPAAGSTTGKTAPGATLTLAGFSLDEPVDKANGGFKSIAQLLVRLNDLDQLNNVWLTDAERKPAYYRGQNVITFTSTSEVAVPSSTSSSTASSVPGKP